MFPRKRRTSWNGARSSRDLNLKSRAASARARSAGVADACAATECELTLRTFDVEGLPRHPREQVDIAGPDRASTETEIGRGQVKRLQQHANILQDQRIGDCTVFPGYAVESCSDRDQDLRSHRCVHRKLRCYQLRLDLVCRLLLEKKHVPLGI